MVLNRKVTGTASSMPAGLALGGCISVIVTVLGALLAANLISKEMIRETSIGYCSMFILLLSSLLGAAVAVRRIKHRRLLVCVASGVLYYGLLLAATALFFGGIYQGMGVTALVILAGCGIVALVGLKGEKSTSRRKNKIRNR